MDNPHPMRTLSQVMETLKERGHDTEILFKDNVMRNEKTQEVYRPEDLTIIRTYRFEGDTNPTDNAILYLVEDQHQQTAYIIDAYGSVANDDDVTYTEFIKKIPVKRV